MLRIRRLVSPVVGAALAVLLMEVVVRDVYTLRTTTDPEIGVIYDPASPVRWRREGNGTSHWDARGVRRNAREVPGTEGRVVVRGDSFTEALMVNDDEAFPSLVQDALAAAGRDLAVLNVGRSTDSAADHVAHAERNRRVFDPRWTVVQLRKEDFTKQGWDESGARFVIASDGALSTVAAPLTGSRTLGALERHSMMLSYGLIRVVEMEAASRNQPPLFRAGDGEPPPPPKDTRVYPIADELAAITEAYGGRITLLWLPDREPEPEDDAFATYCASTNASCVVMRDAFATLRTQGHSPYGFSNTVPETGHLNRHGHRAVAGAVTTELLRLHADGLF